MALWVQQVETAARARGVTLLIQEARTPDDLAPAFEGLAKQRSQAVIVPANGLFQTERTRIVLMAFAKSQRGSHEWSWQVPARRFDSGGSGRLTHIDPKGTKWCFLWRS
jgi:hypothetical protein